MKSCLAILGAALFATAVSAQQAVVVNSCASTVYLQSFPDDGSAAGPLTTLSSGGRFAEDFFTAGSTVKIGTNKALTSPLFFGYSFSTNPDIAYYELSSKFGNPFISFHNILSPGEGCEVFDCAANETDCYSTNEASKVYTCPATHPKNNYFSWRPVVRAQP